MGVASSSDTAHTLGDSKPAARLLAHFQNHNRQFGPLDFNATQVMLSILEKDKLSLQE